MAVSVMQRYELKYLLSGRQTQYVRERLAGRMEPDRYGRTRIASLYYDTPDRRLIRASLEKPEFKEKIRLRSYGPATEESPVFLELKRKACGIVYKRRTETTVPEARAFFEHGWDPGRVGQIRREIAAFRDMYPGLAPSCLVFCDRTAYFEPGGDLRLTIDEDPRYRGEDLSLTRPMRGEPLLGPGWTILEVKVQDAVPLWLAEILSGAKAYRTGFSKYGEAYRLETLGARGALREKEAS